MNPLASSRVTCMLPVKDLARARRFYEDSLGLEALGAKPDGKFIYQCGGTELALFPKPEGTKAEHTALSFRVERIDDAVKALEQRGVRFADYDLPGLKTVDGIADVGFALAAWLIDPHGNSIGLLQFKDAEMN